MSRHWSLSTVMTNFPPQRSCSRSRYRVGMTMRPLASSVSLLAPRNIVRWVARPIFSHFFPPSTTIGSSTSHCQRVKLKKTGTNSDLGHVREYPQVRSRRLRAESISYMVFLKRTSRSDCDDAPPPACDDGAKRMKTLPPSSPHFFF